jgi:hypothetical protein|nr:MAG TPA_asm: hypothetical protein [Caudoviricetes sp.]
MSKIEFILSLLILVCAGVMLVNVFITPSPMKEFAIIVFSIIFLATIALVRLTFKEMIKEMKNE